MARMMGGLFSATYLHTLFLFSFFAFLILKLSSTRLLTCFLSSSSFELLCSGLQHLSASPKPLWRCYDVMFNAPVVTGTFRLLALCHQLLWVKRSTCLEVYTLNIGWDNFFKCSQREEHHILCSGQRSAATPAHLSQLQLQPSLAPARLHPSLIFYLHLNCQISHDE